MLQRNFDPFPALTSQRLRLRRLTSEDVQEIYNLRSNESVNLHLDRKPAQSVDDARIFIEKINAFIDRNEGLYWAICLKENPRLIGTICYFDFSETEESAEIGYELHPFYQHKGIMHEALSVVLPFGFQTLGLKSIIAVLSVKNENSIRLLEKNRFRLEPVGAKPEDNMVKYVRKEKPAGTS